MKLIIKSASILVLSLLVESGYTQNTQECNEDFFGDGAAYRGCKQNKTITGRDCQAWDQQTPHIPRAPLILDKHGTTGTHNYCRNPDGEPTTWCYTMDPEKRWEICVAPTCKEDIEGNGANYRGCQTSTKKGKTCQYWNSETPHKIPSKLINSDAGTSRSHNYCRNPDGKETLWCYTTDPDTPWDFCHYKYNIKETEFTQFPKSQIKGEPKKTIRGLTLNQCKLSCIFERSFDCASLQMTDADGVCYLSDKNKQSEGITFEEGTVSGIAYYNHNAYNTKIAPKWNNDNSKWNSKTPNFQSNDEKHAIKWAKSAAGFVCKKGEGIVTTDCNLQLGVKDGACCHAVTATDPSKASTDENDKKILAILGGNYPVNKASGTKYLCTIPQYLMAAPGYLSDNKLDLSLRWSKDKVKRTALDGVVQTWVCSGALTLAASGVSAAALISYM